MTVRVLKPATMSPERGGQAEGLLVAAITAFDRG